MCAVYLATDLIFCLVFIGFHLALHEERVSVCCSLAAETFFYLKYTNQICGHFVLVTDRQTLQGIEAPSRSLQIRPLLASIILEA